MTSFGSGLYGSGLYGGITFLSTDYTYKFLDTGIVLNDDSVYPFIDIESVLGLDSAEIRVTEREREGTTGRYLDATWERARVVTITGTVFGTGSTLETYLDTLRANFGPNVSPQPFYFKHPSVTQRICFMKSIGLKADISVDRRIGIQPIQIILHAEDPTIFDSSLNVVTTTIAGASTGRSYNRQYNYGYGGTTSTAGAVILNNTGNKAGPCIFRLQNVVNPSIVNDTTGNRLDFNITIAGTDYLDIDIWNKTVTLNGTANRRGTMLGSSSWFLLQPGANSIRFLGTASGSPLLTATFRAAYR